MEKFSYSVDDVHTDGLVAGGCGSDIDSGGGAGVCPLLSPAGGLKWQAGEAAHWAATIPTLKRKGAAPQHEPIRRDSIKGRRDPLNLL